MMILFGIFVLHVVLNEQKNGEGEREGNWPFCSTQQRKVKLKFMKEGNSGPLFRFGKSSMLDRELFSWQDDHVVSSIGCFLWILLLSGINYRKQGVNNVSFFSIFEGFT